MNEDVTLLLTILAYRAPMLLVVCAGLAMLLLGTASGPAKTLGLVGLAVMLASDGVSTVLQCVQIMGHWSAPTRLLSVFNAVLILSGAAGMLLVLFALRQALQASRGAGATPPG